MLASGQCGSTLRRFLSNQRQLMKTGHFTQNTRSGMMSVMAMLQQPRGGKILTGSSSAHLYSSSFISPLNKRHIFLSELMGINQRIMRTIGMRMSTFRIKLAQRRADFKCYPRYYDCCRFSISKGYD